MPHPVRIRLSPYAASSQVVIRLRLTSNGSVSAPSGWMPGTGEPGPGDTVATVAWAGVTRQVTIHVTP